MNPINFIICDIRCCFVDILISFVKSIVITVYVKAQRQRWKATLIINKNRRHTIEFPECCNIEILNVYVINEIKTFIQKFHPIPSQ